MAREPAEPALVDLRPIPMTYEEWRVWSGDSKQSEWVDGEAIPFMPPKTVHALISAFLFRLLADFVERNDLGVVIYAPFEMRLERSAREPDILFIATANLDRLTPEKLLGPADLVVEIVSPDSVTRDRRDKRAEYAAAGVPEYWLLDPRPGRHRADFFLLGADGAHRPAPLDAEGRFRSRVLPGFWLDPDWLWQEPLPKPALLLQRITASDA